MPSRSILALAAALGLAVTPAAAAAQISSVDPDAAMQSDAPVADSDYYSSGRTDQYPAEPSAPPLAEADTTVTEEPGFSDYSDDASSDAADDYSGAETPGYIRPDTPGNESEQTYAGPDAPAAESEPLYADGTAAPPTPGEPDTYQRDDLIAAGAGVFGDGAEGLARMIEGILAEQGEPNGYIVGREAGGAFIFGLRYGSGTLHHRVEGEQPVYWTGPSVGFDFGGNVAQTFVLVYNLYDTEELFQRYPAVEGDAYLIGGLTASYLRSGDKVLIPIRMGAGLRLGANIGYMKFSREQEWLPF